MSSQEQQQPSLSRDINEEREDTKQSGPTWQSLNMKGTIAMNPLLLMSDAV